MREQQHGESQNGAVGRPLMGNGVHREREDADREQAHAESGDRLRHESRRGADAARRRGQITQPHPENP
ncbi:hypothetical protein GCM10010455_08190 [Microbacterium esteraromaticum]